MMPSLDLQDNSNKSINVPNRNTQKEMHYVYYATEQQITSNIPMSSIYKAIHEQQFNKCEVDPVADVVKAIFSLKLHLTGF